MSEIRITSSEDGPTSIQMSGSTLFDWLNLLDIARDEISNKLQTIDYTSLSDCDREIYYDLERAMDKIEEAKSDFEHDLMSQQTDSECEFFYGPKKKVASQERENA